MSSKKKKIKLELRSLLKLETKYTYEMPSLFFNHTEM